MNQVNEIMINLPSQLFIEGNFKTYHSVTIESNFAGILLSQNKTAALAKLAPIPAQGTLTLTWPMPRSLFI
jgi:hypothetical protein